MTLLVNPPKTWEELRDLKDIILQLPGEEVRLPEDQQRLLIFLKVVPHDINLALVKAQTEGKKVALVKNLFPYTRLLRYLPLVQHYVLWSKKGELSVREIKDAVTKRFPDREWFATEKENKYKSVPEIWHTHVFMKNN